MLLLAVRAGGRETEEDSDIGGGSRADAVHAFIEKRYASEVRRVALAVSATALALGIGLGLLALALLWLRNRPRKTAVSRFIESLVVVALLHAAFFAYAMAKAPQLYAAKFYAQGGVLRLAQVLVTDTLGRAGVVVIALAAALFYTRPLLASRLRARASRMSRILRGALERRAGAGGAVVLLVALGSAAVASGEGTAAKAASAPRENTVIASTSTATANAATANPATANAATARPTTRRPNVLILAADSLRNDHVQPRTMPKITRYAQSSVRFTHAYVSLPRTFSSWVTLLSGRYAYHHGVRSMFPRWEDRAKDLDALPERLAKDGYATGVVSDYAGDIFGRVDLGFELTSTPGFDFKTLVRQRAIERETPLLPFLQNRTGRKIFPVLRELSDAADPKMLAGDVHDALKKLANEKRASTKSGNDKSGNEKSGNEKSPFFLTVFFSTAHFPYAAPAPYYSKFTDPKYRGRYKYHKPVGLAHELPPDAEDIAQIQALYAGATSAIDDAMQSVLDDLEAQGLADDTIVVITADHGEALYEDGHGQGHGDHLFGDESTHVPLIIHDPRVKKPLSIDGIVRDVDVTPTLYDLVGESAPNDVDGTSLAPALDGAPLAPRIAFAESELWFTEDIQSLAPTMRMPYPGVFGLTEIDSQHGDEIVLRKNMAALTTMARHRMARDARWKLVYVPTREGVKYMLFDTLADPHELTDVANGNPQEVLRLKADLMAWMLRDPNAKLSGGFVVPKEEP